MTLNFMAYIVKELLCWFFWKDYFNDYFCSFNTSIIVALWVTLFANENLHHLTFEQHCSEL